MTALSPLEVAQQITALLAPLGDRPVTVRATLQDWHLSRSWGRGRLYQPGSIAGTAAATIDIGMPGHIGAAIVARNVAQGTPIAAGKTVEVTGSIRFHPTFGLRIEAEQITVIGLSAAAIEAAELRSELVRGRMGANQGTLQVDYRQIRTVALICPQNGRAGETDARDALRETVESEGIVCPFINTIGVPMSGPHAIRALETALATKCLNADLILIVRGGGSSTDLQIWNLQRVCVTLAQQTKPIVLGIGHSTDQFNVELTVHHAARTPTAAGAWVGQQICAAHAPEVVFAPVQPIPPTAAVSVVPDVGIAWRRVLGVLVMLVALAIALVVVLG